MLTLTKTMLEKSIIDCNAACREEARKMGVDFDAMAPGDKVEIPASFFDFANDEFAGETVIRFYRTKNARGDRRISIKGLRQLAIIGDKVTITYTGAKTLPIVSIGE